MDESLETPAPAGTVPPSAAAERWSFPRRAAAVFAAPRSLFEHLEHRPTWLVPTLVLVLATVAFVVILWDPVIAPEQLEQLEASGNASEQAVEMMTGSVGRAIATATTAVGALITVLLYALGVFVVGGFLLGGNLSYRQALAIVSHTGLVAIPSVILRIPLAMAAKTSQVSLGPGALFPPSAAEGFGARFLSYILFNLDVFTLWQTALVALGTSIVARLAPQRAAVGIWSLFALYVLIGSLIGAVAAGMR